MRSACACLANDSIDSGADGHFQRRRIPLGWLFARGFVTPRQFDAGERLARRLGARAAGAASHDVVGCCADRAAGAAVSGCTRTSVRANRCQAPLRPGDRRGGPGSRRHPVADRLRRRRDARRRNGARLAGEGRKAGADARPRPCRRLLPAVASPCGRRDDPPAPSRARCRERSERLVRLIGPVADRRVAHVVPALVVAAVAPHDRPLLLAHGQTTSDGAAVSAVRRSRGGFSP